MATGGHIALAGGGQFTLVSGGQFEWFFQIYYFSKNQNLLKTDITRLQQSISEAKEQSEKNIDNYKSGIDNQLNTIRESLTFLSKSTSTDMRIFRDIILPEYYTDPEAVNRIVDKLYRYHFNVLQLEEYGLDRIWIDAFKLHVNNQETKAIHINNPSAARILGSDTNDK